MLTFRTGKHFENCDKLARRSFICAGSLGIAGLSLPEILAAESSGKSRGPSPKKSVIILHLDGGPPQMDLIDPKPLAPVDLRSPFRPLSTSVPGIQLTELMPKCANIVDQLVLLRALTGSDGKHHAFQCQSGYHEKVLQAMGGRPAVGCVVNHLMSTPQDRVPNFVDLMQGRPLVRNSARPGFLGPSVKPFRPDISDRWKRELEPGMKGELARLGKNHKTPLRMIDDIPVSRLDNRLELLAGLDGFRTNLDASGSMDAMNEFQQQAYRVLTSGAFADAMNIDAENAGMMAHYTPGFRASGKQTYTSEGPDAILKFMLARRLIEAGVRVVSLSLSDFDTHADNNVRMKNLGPLFDFGFHALVSDLKQRDMLDDVLVLAWGEFGRTPKYNGKAGRDHWPRLSMGMMAGGGFPGGIVLGASDKTAADVTDRPISFADVIATIYRHLGIDPQRVIYDRNNRPHVLMDEGDVIRELV
ncbi:MAG: DUF1501 domain-containing protein [Planctomycetota bacterium]